MCSKMLLFDGKLKNALDYQTSFKEKPKDKIYEGDDEMCLKILTELYCSEVMYIFQLELLIKYFMEPIQSANQLPLAVYQLLFGNIESLYNINRQLLDAINENPHEPEKAFCALGPFFKLYSVYACGYRKAVEYLMKIEKEFKKVAEFIHNQETRPEVATSLASLLIVPVQRVPRYRLILQSLLKHSIDEQKHQNIKEALEKISESAEHMNKFVLEAEDGEKMVQLARRLGSDGLDLVIPGRKLLKQGFLMQTSRDGTQGHRRFLVLLSDALLCCKGDEEGPLSLYALMPLKQLDVSAVLDSSTLIKVVCGSTTFFLFTSDTKCGREWLSAIVTAKKEELENRQTLRKDTSKQKLILRQKITARRVINRAKRLCLKRLKENFFKKGQHK